MKNTIFLRLIWTVVFLGNSLILSTVGISGAPGDLDPTFGDGGIAMFDYHDLFVCCIEKQPDGKFLVGGNKWFWDGTSRLVLRRHNTDGSLDTSFGFGGDAIAEFTSSPLYVKRVDGTLTVLKVQADGKIIVGGYNNNSESASKSIATVWRFTSAGLLDMSFGDKGKRMFLDPHVVNSYFSDLALTHYGKILISYKNQEVGPFNNIITKTYLTRLNSNGTTDTSFGTGFSGRVHTPNGSNIAVDNGRNGAIYVATKTSDYYPVITRFSLSGLPDTSYGDGGTTASLGNVCNADLPILYISSLALDGTKLIAAGIRGTPNQPVPDLTAAISRYTSSGSVDDSFGINGTLCYPSFNAEEAKVSRQSDGRLLIVSFVYPFSPLQNSNSNFFKRVQSDSTEDASFNPEVTKSSHDLSIQSDGKIVVLALEKAQFYGGYQLIRYLP